MTSYKNQYKINNGFGDIKNNRTFNKKICDIKRKEQRVENYAIKRELKDFTDATTSTDGKDSKRFKLLRWKAERDRRKKMEQEKKKPPFIVGKVHHHYYSPSLKDSVKLSTTKQCLHDHKKIIKCATPSKRITRATQKLLSQKCMVSNKVPQIQNIAGKETENNSVKNKKSFIPNNYKFTAPSGLKNMPLFGHIAMLHTPVKALTSAKKENTAEVFLSKRKSKSSHPENDVTETDEKDETSDIDMTNESIEAITLKISFDEHEITFDNSVKEGEFLRHSTFSNSSHQHSPIIPLPNIFLNTSESTTMTEDQSNNETEISSARNIAEMGAEKETPKNTNNKQIEVTPPLRKSSLVLNDINSPKDPVFFSSYIVSSHGKSSAKKEQQIHCDINCSPSENIPIKETVMEEEEECTAQYFALMLDKETCKLNKLCKKWTKIQSELDITEDAQYHINQAIGQTHLLINKKFERFRGLVLDCETGKEEMLVTCRDLQGFWDMMYIEIMNCDSRFKTLEKLRSNGWKEEEIAVIKDVPKKKVISKKKMVYKKKSSVQDFILAAKEKVKNKTENLKILKDQMNESINNLSTSISNIDIQQNKNEVLRKNDTRQSISMNSKDRLSVSDKKTSSRQSLLQKAFSPQSCKTVKTPMTIMKISQMCRTSTIKLDDSISHINSKQTPGKSILKETDDFTINEIPDTKSVQRVNFDNHVISQRVAIDKEMKNKLDLAARLARKDTFDLDTEYMNYIIRAETKLNFNDNSFLDSESNLQCNTEQLNLSNVIKEKNDTLLNFKTGLVGNTAFKSEDISLKKSLNKCIQNETNIKILRNRAVITGNSTRISIARRSKKDLVDGDKGNQKENKTPVKSERSSKLLKQKEPITTKETPNATPVNLRKDLRRSSRKSVRFNAEECMVCTEYKPIHPITPHTRRKGNLNLSYLQDISPMKLPSPNTNLISWDSPKRNGY